jgi:enoyl-CoA hydratase/carnithine racemase
MYGMPDEIQVTADGPLRIITLNRPDELNAVNDNLHVGLAKIWDAINEDAGARAAVITGAGRAFSAGGDFNYLDELRRDEALRIKTIKHGRDLVIGMVRCRVPVIAAVNGPAVGIGVTMQLAMDIRIASENARFGFVFSQRGIVPEAASSWFLPRIVGISQALEWCYTGRVFPAQEALAGRLVSKVVSPDELLPTARALAREIATKTAPVSVALIRQMMWRMSGADDPMEAHKVDSRGIYARGRSDDVKEGVVSFLEKRPANFKNKVSADMPDYFPWWDEREYE